MANLESVELVWDPRGEEGSGRFGGGVGGGRESLEGAESEGERGSIRGRERVAETCRRGAGAQRDNVG